MASYQCILRFFHSTCLKYRACQEKVMPGHMKCCTCHAKSSSQNWRSYAPKCKPLSRNQRPANSSDEHVSCSPGGTFGQCISHGSPGSPASSVSPSSTLHHLAWWQSTWGQQSPVPLLPHAAHVLNSSTLLPVSFDHLPPPEVFPSLRSNLEFLHPSAQACARADPLTGLDPNSDWPSLIESFLSTLHFLMITPPVLQWQYHVHSSMILFAELSGPILCSHATTRALCVAALCAPSTVPHTDHWRMSGGAVSHFVLGWSAALLAQGERVAAGSSKTMPQSLVLTGSPCSIPSLWRPSRNQADSKYFLGRGCLVPPETPSARLQIREIQQQLVQVSLHWLIRDCRSNFWGTQPHLCLHYPSVLAVQHWSLDVFEPESLGHLLLHHRHLRQLPQGHLWSHQELTSQMLWVNALHGVRTTEWRRLHV